MITKFDTLCEALRIDGLLPIDEDLAKLIHWCETTVSTDHHFDGNVKERFDAYQDLASGFLERVQPNVSIDHMTSPVVVFDNMTPLQMVVYFGLNVYLQTLKPSSEQINTKVNGITLLHLAAARGNLHTIETLLSLGANPLEKSTSAEPLLFTTLMLPLDHNKQMIKKKQAIYGLLSTLANSLWQEKNESGDTVLHIMSVYGYKTLIKETLDHSIELASVANNTMRYPIHSAVLNGQWECVKVLAVVPGVDILIDAKGRNALHYAAKYGDVNMISSCLHAAISKNAVDKRQQSPLIIAVIAQNPNAVKALIDSGVQINMADDLNRSALHYAVLSNDLDSVKLLLEATDVDVNIRDHDAHHPLDLIQKDAPESDEIRALLLSKGATTRLSR